MYIGNLCLVLLQAIFRSVLFLKEYSAIFRHLSCKMCVFLKECNVQSSDVCYIKCNFSRTCQCEDAIGKSTNVRVGAS